MFESSSMMLKVTTSAEVTWLWVKHSSFNFQRAASWFHLYSFSWLFETSVSDFVGWWMESNCRVSCCWFTRWSFLRTSLGLGKLLVELIELCLDILNDTRFVFITLAGEKRPNLLGSVSATSSAVFMSSPWCLSQCSWTWADSNEVSSDDACPVCSCTTLSLSLLSSLLASLITTEGIFLGKEVCIEVTGEGDVLLTSLTVERG